MLFFLLPAFALLVSVSADFIDALPKCWRSCVKDSNLNCDGWDLSCICKASKGSFLTDTISCARSECDSDDWDVQLFLGPLEVLCATVGESIPNSIIKVAENCATQTAKQPPASTAKHVSSKVHSDKSQDYITTTYTTTITETRTDSQGSTVYVIIPVIVEPSTFIYGKPSTSIAKGNDEPSTTDGTTVAESTVLISPSPLSSSTPTAAATSGSQQAAESGTATSSSKKGGPTDNSNGSPFTNPQAAASTQSRSWVLALFGLLVALF